MKKVLLVLALVLVIALPVSAAGYMKTNGIGVGLSGGWPVSGVAVKYGMDDFRLVGTVGYSFNSAFAIEAGAQYDVTEFDIDGIPFYVNVGVTASMNIGSGFGATINVPVGVSYFFEDFPMEVFLKVGPGIKLLPAPLAFDIGVALGGLWYLEK